MIRLLHTADWHLGRTMRGRSRAPEFAAALRELCEVAVQEHVDVVLVAGDIWDSMSPAPEADRLLNAALRRFIQAGMDMVLIAGNHDNPRRLEALGELAELLGVRTQAYVRRWDDGGTLIVEREREGARADVMRLAAVPWVPEGRALNASEILGPEAESFQRYHDFVDGVYRQAVEGFEDGAVNVFASHVFVDGAHIAVLDGSERRIHIGQTYAVAPAVLPAHAQYVALGHVHEPQEVVGAPNHAATYAGSLLQLDFGERGQQKVARIVDLEPGRPARHRAVPLTAGRRLAELRGTPEEVLAQGEGAGDAFLRAFVRLDAPQPGLAARLREALPNLVDVRVEMTAPVTGPAEPDLQSLTPQDLFVRYYQQRNGVAPSPEVLAVFREVVEAASREAAKAT